MSTILNAIAFAALFAAHLLFSGELDGVRRALQTIAAGESQIILVETTQHRDSVSA